MCDPTMIFTGIGTAISMVSTVASIGSSSSSTATEFAERQAEIIQQQTNYQAELAKQKAEYQARLNERSAQAALAESQAKQANIRRGAELEKQQAALEAEKAQRLGFQKLHSLGSHTGVRLDTGSPLAASTSILADQELGTGLAEYKSALADWEADLNAGLTEWQGLTEANQNYHNAALALANGANATAGITYGGAQTLNDLDYGYTTRYGTDDSKATQAFKAAKTTLDGLNDFSKIAAMMKQSVPGRDAPHHPPGSRPDPPPGREPSTMKPKESP